MFVYWFKICELWRKTSCKRCFVRSISRIKNERKKHWWITCLVHQTRQISKCKRILQYNFNRSTNVMQTIVNYAVKNTNIVVLQESWIENNIILISHSAFTKIAFAKQENFKAHTMTFISKKANLKSISRYDISNDSNIQMLNILSNIENFTIFNIYNEKSAKQHEKGQILQIAQFEPATNIF